jgi:ATPase subunit of ABC transporter with duplicated ATPase domains
MERILSGLHANDHSSGNITLNTRLPEVSSGQLKRILIARALYSQADLLLFDDPTSHLDVYAVQWLADFLQGTKSAIVISSNNKTFLDKCATQTVGFTDSGRVFIFAGNYSDFLLKRDSVVELEKEAADSANDKIQQLRGTDRMFRSRQAYSRSENMAQVGRALETRIRKLEERHSGMPGAQEIYVEVKIKDLIFTPERRSGSNVVTIERVLKKYGEYAAVDLTEVYPINITRGDKWLIWGPNGSGKSTLVSMVESHVSSGNFLPDQGEINIGLNVDAEYFNPNYLPTYGEGLLIDEVTTKMGILNDGLAREVLSFFGFSLAAMYNQKTDRLSSGERKRLELSKIMLRNPNLLILDEPTGDYMPEEIKIRFANALKAYQGTLILVSHDVKFISILEIDHQLNMPTGTVSGLNIL